MADTHPCIGKGCEKELRTDILACAKHWFMLPREMRRDVAKAWRDGDTEIHLELRAQAFAFLHSE